MREHPQRRRPRGSLMQLAVVLALIFAVAISLFAVQNTTPVELSFLTYRVEQVAISLLVLIAAALGAALTFALGLVREVQHRVEVRGLREEVRIRERRNQELAAQLAQRELPAANPVSPEPPGPAESPAPPTEPRP